MPTNNACLAVTSRSCLVFSETGLDGSVCILIKTFSCAMKRTSLCIFVPCFLSLSFLLLQSSQNANLQYFQKK